MIKLLLFILISISLFSCQKEIENLNYELIKITSNKTSIVIGSEERATISVVLNGTKPGTTFDLEIEGGTIEGQTTLSNIVPLNDKAEFEYVPGNIAGSFYIKAKIHDKDYYSTVEIKILDEAPPIELDSVLNLSLEQPGIFYADGASTVNVVATITNNNATELTFTSPKGKFNNGNNTIVVPISSGQASTTFTFSNEAVTHVVTTSIAGGIYSRDISIDTSPSLPESIFLTSNSSVVDSSDVSISENNIQFTILLDKNIGKVSLGQPVVAEAYQMPGGIQTFYGTFYSYPLESDINEKVVCKYFTSPGLNKNLPLFVRFTTNGATGVLLDTIILTVN